VINLPRREKASLNKCEQNFGSSSTHEKLPVSSFSANVMCAIMCDQVIIIQCLRLSRGSKLDGSEQGEEVWDV